MLPAVRKPWEGFSFMTTIKDLLSRIRWDPGYGRGRYVVGYEDHVAGGVVRVALSRVRAGDGFSFSLVDDQGTERTIPYHRIREVLRDGEVIWHRPH